MKTNTYLGKFIVFEGLDGSGQSTQVKLLGDFFTKNGFQVVLTKEPTKTSVAAKKIRKTLDEKIKISSTDLQKLFCEDRREHLEKKIIPALKKGKIVISDRYFFSTFAYGVSDGISLDFLLKLNDKFLLPNLSIILKVSPKECIKRIEKRGIKKQLFEKEKKLAQAWKTYNKMPKILKNVHIIDGEPSKEKVSENIKKIIISKLLNK